LTELIFLYLNNTNLTGFEPFLDKIGFAIIAYLVFSLYELSKPAISRMISFSLQRA